MDVMVLGVRALQNVEGGVETHCKELYSRLAAADVRVTVLARKSHVSAARRVECLAGVRVVYLWCPRARCLETIVHTFLGALLCCVRRADVVHCHNIGPGLFLPLLKLAGMRTVLTVHSRNYLHRQWGPIARMVFRLGEDLGVHAADGIIVVSQEIAEHIERKYGKTAVVIGNGAPIPQEKQSPDHLLEMGIQPNRYILAVGRLVPDKGFHKLIEAFTSLDTNDALLRHQGWKLLIVGNLNRRDEYCRSLVSRSRAVRNVILTGFLERPMLDELYAHAGLFVLPSCHEGHSVTLLEALSHGASCLASDIPANRVFRMEEYRYFKPDDVDALALGIRRLCGMPWSADARRAQIERTRQRFDWNEIAERTKGVYEAVVSGTVLKPR